MGYIKSHNYKPEYVFHKLGDEEELYLGVELEVDIGGENENSAAKVLELLNNDNQRNAYCMHDGSLNGGSNRYNLTTGFEITTMPCTLTYHKTLNYEEAFEFLMQEGYKSHDTSTCGLHIHVNRNYFGSDKLTQDLNICKLMFLFESYWDNIVLVARRNHNHYARRSSIDSNESLIDLYSKSKSKGKYAAINLEHKDTIEIRIFKGTLNYKTYMLTLEFVYDMCHIAKETDIYDIQLLKWSDIENYFSKELIAYIEKRKAIKETSQTKIIEVDTEGAVDWREQNTISASLVNASEMNIARRRCGLDYLQSMMLSFNSRTQSIPQLSINHHQGQTALTQQELLKRKIKNTETLIRYSSNEVQKINLRRSIVELRRELKDLRSLERQN